jgi:Flp pilus assembly protein protease CpaA
MILLWSSFWLISLPIIVRDLASQRIPNLYLKVLTIPTCLFLIVDGTGPLHNLLVNFLVLVLGIFLGVGMGDIKLLAISFMIFNSQMNFSIHIFLAILLAGTSAHLLIHILVARQMPQRIALAPSVFLAFALYFAAR